MVIYPYKNLLNIFNFKLKFFQKLNNFIYFLIDIVTKNIPYLHSTILNKTKKIQIHHFLT